MSLSHQNMVLSAKDVAYLITKRECLGKLVLSVKGTVTALSDVMRAGKNQIVLVQVDKCIILVIKDFHPEWHSVLEVGEVFVFQNLRLTTLEKGILKPCSVLLVLETSSLTCLKDENAVTPVSLQDWLKMNSICDVLLKPETCEAASEEIQELVNYEGTVTSTDMASIGMFVLDGKLRLVTAADSVASIRKHSRVSVYNAHIIKDSGQAYLMCCMRSCIRIHESVSSVGDSAVTASANGMEVCVSATVEDPVNNKLRTFIHKLIRKYGLNLKEIVALQQLYRLLFRQGRSRSCQENMLSHFVKSEICANLTKSCGQATDLFIFHEQLCPFNQSKPQVSRIPHIMDLCDLKKEVTNIKSTLDSASVLAEPGITSQSSPHHLKVCFSSGKILTGCIMVCSEGIVFQDGTAELRVIIMSDSDAGHTGPHSDVNSEEDPSRCCKDTTDHHSQPHLCCQCCFDHCQPGKRPTCPVLDAWVVGATICVTKFHVVLEGGFDTRTGGAGEAGQQNLDGVCMYLAFSLLDCILLDTVEKISPVMGDSARVSASPLLPADLSSHGRLPGKHKQQESACYVYVCEKQPLTYTSNQFKNEKSYQFQLLGSKVYLDLNTEKNVRCCDDSCVRRRKSTFIMDSEILAEQQENSLQDSHQQGPDSMCAFFLNSTAKWYSCFTSGHLYKLSTSYSSSDSDPFKCKLLKVLPQKVAERYNVRMNIEVPEDVFVERVPRTLLDPGWGLDDGETLHPIGYIMSASFSETVVSFKGVIVGRERQASFTSNIKTGRMCSSMTNTKLEVQAMLPDTADNVVCGRAITVYLDAPRTVYTLGLVPGAVVKFCRVERKISKAGNIYCRFIAVSVAEVVQFQDLSASTRSQTGDINMASLPRELLFNIRQRPTEDWQTENQVFSISCHIERIFSLRIKTVCSSCKSMFSQTRCQSRDCGSAAWPVAVASAVLLVGDGTCPATVKIWDSYLICRLLTLTANQWEDLVTEVTSHGEVVLEYSSPPISSITMFLQELISSPLVLRPCRMAVRKYKGNTSSDLNKIRLEDFHENEVKVGKHVLRTLSLPRMQLDCLAIS